MNRQLGIRRSYINETRRLALEFIERGQQTLVFANNRLATEILVTYLKDACDARPAADGNRARVSRRLSAARAAGDRAQAARWRDPRGGGDQRARTGHRYRLARRRGDGRLSGHHRLHVAARGPRRDAGRARRPRCWWHRARRSISTSSSIPTTSSAARPSMRTSMPTIWRSCWRI